MTTQDLIAFSDLNLSQPVLQAITDIGYETPSPIQAQTIPMLLEGVDLVGQAQTGTGKTAAFALPLLSKMDVSVKPVQALVLTPTRELAIQVAEAFHQYAKNIKGFHVLPIYGGQDYRTQLRALARGVNVVVGTPGRVMDHMRRGTLKLDGLTTLVLDEADEMLRMGFIDDVEWILEKTPAQRQIALFSATMPSQIRRIATKYLNNPEHVTVESKTRTASTIRQRYCTVSGAAKLDVLTRILEAEIFDAMLVFVRTKTSTLDLSEKLEARGYACSPLNGDIPQNQREKTVDNLKKGKIDIIVATDVAARGLDVSRISHVINYDIPTDIEAYIHRIGRTGRAGRHGDAILFAAPRERRLQYAIEKATGKTIELMELPTNDTINDRRVARFKQRITDTLASNDLTFFEELVETYQKEHDVPSEKVAAALAQLMQGDTPFLYLNKPPRVAKEGNNARDRGNERDRSKRGHGDESSRRQRSADPSGESSFKKAKFDKSERKSLEPVEKGMERFRLEVGADHNVKPANIVGAIANEAGIESQYMGRIVIESDHSLIDLPEGMPKEIFSDLKKTRVCGIPIRMSKLTDKKGPSYKSDTPKKSKNKIDKKAKAATDKRAKLKTKLKAKAKEKIKKKKRNKQKNTADA
ncbi:MAG: DEAD/DEAH box helicase [Granulosicoccaceae bacterium]